MTLQCSVKAYNMSSGPYVMLALVPAEARVSDCSAVPKPPGFTEPLVLTYFFCLLSKEHLGQHWGQPQEWVQ